QDSLKKTRRRDDLGTNTMRKLFWLGMFVASAFALAVGGPVFRPLFSVDAQKGATDMDVQHYKIDAELIPASQTLKARAEVRFIPKSETGGVFLKMKGALTINGTTRGDGDAKRPPAVGVPGGRPPNLKVSAPAKAKESNGQPASDSLQFI